MAHPKKFPDGSVGLTVEHSPSAEQLARLDALCFDDSWGPEAFTALLDNPALRAWILSQEDPGGDTPIAHAFICFQLIENEAEILRIGVVPDHRGRGLGRKLLGGLLAEFNASNVRRVTLEVRAGNHPARRLYESLGFTLGSLRADYYRKPTEDACLYVWNGT